MNKLRVVPQHTMRLYTLLLGLVPAAGSRCASAAESLTPHRPTETSPSTIRGLNGPEDMQLTTDGKHIVVSELPMDFAHSLPSWNNGFSGDRYGSAAHSARIALSPSASLTEAIRLHWREYLMEGTEIASLMLSICVFGTLLYSSDSPFTNYFVNSREIRSVLMGIAIAATTYLIIDSGGTVRAADADPDYTVRPEPAETVRVLEVLKRGKVL